MVNDPISSLPLHPSQLIADYKLAVRSRQAAVIGRREVLTGKANFGIFGDGKELIQLAIAHAFQLGDWRSGYYRDQTLMFALGLLTFEQFFAQLYAHEDVNVEPQSGGRNMTGHFASRLLDPDGSWRDQMKQYNSAADLAPTGAQMPRTVGLAYASVLYRKLDQLKQYKQFSNNGNEVTWASIGNASTAEGVFWEAVNAIGVLHAPAIISIYDDGYGISVPNEFQMVKGDIYAILKGFERIPCPAEECDRGFDLYTVHAWDYSALIKTYQDAGAIARKYHIPALVHVTEATQPLGHSTSGSQERYKSPEQLAWEAKVDCNRMYRTWLVENKIATEAELDGWDAEETHLVEEIRKKTYKAYQEPILQLRTSAIAALKGVAESSTHKAELLKMADILAVKPDPVFKRDIAEALQSAMISTRGEHSDVRDAVVQLANRLEEDSQKKIGSNLYSDSVESPFLIKPVPAMYSDSSPTVMGFEIINDAFDAALAREPRLVAFGEDLGKLGDVNQGFRGMQIKYGALRVTDTGIREATILGQAIGMALRGLRPICEIQYLDYLLYAMQIMADDLANLHWRTAGGQKAPVIIRTRGHRLEGVFHSGSPMAGIINLVRGMLVLVPRNFTQAAGFYNMLLKSDNPALVVEVLNAYRHKERLPDNLGEIIVPPGIPEVLRTGESLTIVTYGACCPIVLGAAGRLAEVGISSEVIDVQSLLPFDTSNRILESVKKTNRVLFVDEDVPGGTTAYMLQQVLEGQDAYRWLDSEPRTLPGAAHRPAYGSDGDYWSKPNRESVFRMAYEIMREGNPAAYPSLDGK
ncbi:MAG: thiamine pyrophosphate-dependent enzyme [Anaerolineaceae bacterium]